MSGTDLEMFAAFTLSDMLALVTLLERNPSAASAFRDELATIADRINNLQTVNAVKEAA